TWRSPDACWKACRCCPACRAARARWASTTNLQSARRSSPCDWPPSCPRRSVRRFRFCAPTAPRSPRCWMRSAIGTMRSTRFRRARSACAASKCPCGSRHPRPRNIDKTRRITGLTTPDSENAVQSAFALEAEETGVFRIHARFPTTAGVAIADRDVALVPQRVVWQAMAAQVMTDIAVAPVGQRMQFPAAMPPFENIDRGAAARLLPAQAGDPAARVQLVQGPLHRLDLAQLVVAIDPGNALLPQAPVARLHACRAERRLVNLEVQLQPLGE